MTDDMQTGQKVWLTVFLIGLAAFFYSGAEALAKHTAWTDFQTPIGVGEVFRMLASVTAVIGGALGLDIAKLMKK